MMSWRMIEDQDKVNCLEGNWCTTKRTIFQVAMRWQGKKSNFRFLYVDYVLKQSIHPDVTLQTSFMTSLLSIS